MNKERRKLKAEAVELLDSAYDILVQIAEEESEAYENLPDGIQESERGENMYLNVDMLETCYLMVEECIENLGEIQ